MTTSIDPMTPPSPGPEASSPVGSGAHAEVTPGEARAIERANASGRPPVVFVHGLWLLANSWDRWAALFEEAGYAAIAPSWPDDPDTVAAARAQPQALAGKTVGRVARHLTAIVERLALKPALVGHSFGGVVVEMLAGRGLSAATVAIAPAPFRGVLALPLSSVRSAWPALRNPANARRAVPLTFAQFRYAFANAVSEDEAKELYAAFSVPAPGAPLFQAATANVDPWTEVKVDVANPARGPMLIVSGDKDNTVPWAIANASYGRQKRNPGVTEIAAVPGRGHSLTIDHGWRAIADTALAFVKRFVPADVNASRPATTAVA